MSAGGPASWHIAHLRGEAATFHARTPDVSVGGPRQAWVFDVARPALALGSAQRDAAVDGRVAAALGIDLVHRRSGGGAVLMLPGEIVWVDLVIARDDARWDDDIGRSMHWVGHAWSAALASLGVGSSVHTGALVASRWSSAVCFAGLGAGEVVDPAGRKIVGVAQRRTRDWARFQTMCHLRWRPEIVAALAVPPRPTADELAPLVATVPADASAVVAALLAALPSLLPGLPGREGLQWEPASEG